MTGHPLAVFVLVLSNLTVILCCAILVSVLPRSTVTRPVGKLFTGIFFGCMGLLALDELITVLFHPSDALPLTELPVHMLVLRLVRSIGLAGLTIALIVDSDRWRRRVSGDDATPAERERMERSGELGEE